MTAIIIPRKHLVQPQGRVELDSSHDLFGSLLGCWCPVRDVTRELRTDAPLTWATTPSNWAGARVVPTADGLAYNLGLSQTYYIAISSTISGVDIASDVSLFMRSAPNTTDWKTGRRFKSGNWVYSVSAVSAGAAKQRLTRLSIADYDADGFYIKAGKDSQSHGFVRQGTTGKFFVGRGEVFSTPVSDTGFGDDIELSNNSGSNASDLMSVAYFFATALDANRWADLDAHPWQLFRADPVRIYSLPSGPITINSITASDITSSSARITLGVTR